MASGYVKKFFDDHAQKIRNDVKMKREHANRHSPEQFGFDKNCKYCTANL